ncbi:choice-of-anchor D domain-containing protein [Haladaptatus sp. DFWS20]|uniref:choice-of-anchor D domain-containing protein n=1 Tax=Haladaptatus sp. DFWS20 TaxID=3403467 RepID=UPI003EBB36AE
MPEYRTPGVYVEEVDRGPKPIEGVSTSIAGFLGETERGPTDPEFVTSFADFERKYGGFALYKDGEPLASTNLAYAVDGFFRNGGRQAYIGRITPEDTPTARADLRANEPGTLTPRVDFGTVSLNKKSTKTLTLTNLTNNKITIENPASPIGDFSLGSPTSNQLEAGESTTIEVAFTPDSKQIQEENLDIDYQDPETNLTESIQIHLNGVGGDDLAADKTHLEFGSQVVTSDVVKTVSLTNTATDTVTIENDEIHATDGTNPVNVFKGVVKTKSVGQNGTTTLTVRFTPDTIEKHTADLKIPYKINNTPGELTIRMDGEGISPLELSHETIDFGTLDDSTSSAGPVTLTLTNSSEAEVELGTLNDLTSEGFDAGAPSTTTLSPDGESEATIEITFESSDENKHEGVLDIPYTFDGSGDQHVFVDLVGLGAGDLAADRLEIDFGSVLFSEHSEPETITLTSQTNDTVEISPLSSASDAFTIEDPDPTELTGEGNTATLSVTFNPQETNPPETNPAEETLTIEYTVGGSQKSFEIDLSGRGADPFDVSTSVTFGSMEAVGPGIWGSNIAAYVEPGTLHKPESPLFKLTLRYWSYETDAQFVQTHGIDHDAAPDPDVEEVYDNLSLEETSSNYFTKQINSGSKLVEVAREGSALPSNWNVEPTWLTESFTSPTPDAAVKDYVGQATPGERTGLAAFEEVDDISILCVPDEARDSAALKGLTDKIVSHCEKLKDRFAILQAPEDAGDLETIEPRSDSARIDTKYAAYYFPWLKIRNPETSLEKLVPPGGHVAGIYARSDAERGVHKAPANELVGGTHELQLTLTDEEQGLLNPKGVNCLRNFPGRGIRVWGARVSTTDPSWKYVNVRRLFLYLEESIDEGTQWVVFEPNDQNLWARVRQTITNFLTTVWRNGALMGTTAEEAFYVKCDQSTMTQADIDSGRLIAEIGVAPVKPAEFVIFRISQWTGGAEGA